MTVDKNLIKSVRIRTTGAKKRHLTLVLAGSAAGDFHPSTLIFEGVLDLKDLKITKISLVTVQKRAWTDEALMLQWIQEVYIKHTQKERSLFILDSFAAHKKDPVKKALRKGHVVLAVIPGGCTSKLLPPYNVSIQTVKAEISKGWTSFFRNVAEKLAEKECMSTIKTAYKKTVNNWIDDAIKSLNGKPEIIKKSFKVCGISNHRNGSQDNLVCSSKLEPTLGDEYVEFDGFDSNDLIQALAKLRALQNFEDLENS